MWYKHEKCDVTKPIYKLQFFIFFVNTLFEIIEHINKQKLFALYLWYIFSYIGFTERRPDNISHFPVEIYIVALKDEVPKNSKKKIY